MLTLTNGQKKLQHHIQEQYQVENAISFAKNYPKLPYEQLSSLIDFEIAPVQLIWLLADEASLSNQIDWFIKDALVREMQAECPDGWHYDQHANFQTAGAIASWISTIGYLGQEIVDTSNIARGRLKQLALEGWLPSSIDDPTIQKAFEDILFVPKLIKVS